MNKDEHKIIVNVENNEIRVAILENSKLSEYYIDNKELERNVGNVYKGIVDKVVPGIQSAFVDIGLEKNGFLHVSDICGDLSIEDQFDDEDFDIEQYKKKKKKKDIQNILKEGDELIVQVDKDPINTKGVKLTTYISLPGRFSVLMPNVKHRGISKKIQVREERSRLRDMLNSASMLKEYGCIVRTAGEAKHKRQILSDLKYLVKTWNVILKGMKKKKGSALLHEESSLITRIVRDHFGENITEFLIDSKQEYNKIKSFVGSTIPDIKKKLKNYNNEEPIFEYYNLEKEIRKIYKKTVQLKCGGYLVIEQTEALVSIDVNTGKHTGKGDFEETILRTNLDAAEELPRQLKLRDIGGLIKSNFHM